MNPFLGKAWCSSVFIIFCIATYAHSCFSLKNNSINYNVTCSSRESNNVKFQNIIIFGDSIVDPGNNNYIKTIFKCNFPPYGRDFPGGKPTGRFSDGKIASDFLVEEIGVKELLPAYLEPNLQLHDLITGVSFGSGGSGYDPLTAQIASVLSLSDQSQLFEEYLTKIKSSIGEDKTRVMISKAMFIVSSGSNDLLNTLPLRRFQHVDVNSYTDFLVNSAMTFLQELCGHGARRIAVLGIPTIGCVPEQRTINGGIKRECSVSTNNAAMLFNFKLSSKIDALNTKLPGSKIVYLDVYNPLLSLIKNYAHYGFQEANKGCCGTGNIEAGPLCNSFEDHKTCKDASNYVFWDSVHPTERALQILVPEIIKKNINKFF